MRTSKTTYYLKPRYTPGSPGMVDYDTARREITDEREGYEHALSGLYGADQQKRAETLGLHGIIEARGEVKNGWQVHDLITDATYFILGKQADILRDVRLRGCQVLILNGASAYLERPGQSLQLVELKDVRELARNHLLRPVSQSADGREQRLCLWEQWEGR